MILGRSSLIQTPCTLAQSSMSEHSSPAKTPGLAKRTLQTGLRALHLNPRLRSCHPQRSQLRRNNPDTMEVDEICINDVPNGVAVSIGRIDKKVERKTGDFVTSQAAGDWGMARRPIRSYVRRDFQTRLQSVRVAWQAGRSRHGGLAACRT